MTPERLRYARRRIIKLKDQIAFCERKLGTSIYTHTIKELRKSIASSKQAIRRWNKEMKS